MADASETKIVISGIAYGLDDSLGRAALGDLYTLKVKLGVSVKTITETFKKFGVLAEREDFSPLDLLDDEDIIRNIQGIVYLARRKAGDDITCEQAGEVSFMDVEFQLDEEDEAAVEAPKAQTDSVPVASAAKKTRA